VSLHYFVKCQVSSKQQLKTRRLVKAYQKCAIFGATLCMDHAVMQSLDPVSRMTCHRPWVHHPPHSDSFKTHWRRYCFVQSTGLKLAYLLTHLLTYLMLTLIRTIQPLNEITSNFRNSWARSCNSQTMSLFMRLSVHFVQLIEMQLIFRPFGMFAFVSNIQLSLFKRQHL